LKIRSTRKTSSKNINFICPIKSQINENKKNDVIPGKLYSFSGLDEKFIKFSEFITSFQKKVVIAVKK
jgi:hypothetical protein